MKKTFTKLNKICKEFNFQLRNLDCVITCSRNDIAKQLLMSWVLGAR